MPDCLSQLQILLDGLPVPAYICDSVGEIIHFNEQALRLWGMAPVAGDPGNRYVGPVEFVSATTADAQAASIIAQVLANGPQQAEVCVRLRDGTQAKWLVNAHPIREQHDGVVGICCTVKDLSLHQQNKQELIRHIDFCELVIKTTAEGICVCYPLEYFPYIRFTVWNERMTEITGYTLEEINELGWYQTLYPDAVLQALARQRMEMLRVGHDLRNEEWRITRKTGDQRVIRISTSLLAINEDDSAVVALIQDVTEEATFKDALRDSDQRLQLAVEAAQLGPWDWDIASSQVFYSREWCKQLGYEIEELEGSYSDWERFLHPDDKPIVLANLNAYLNGTAAEYKSEFRMRHKDGTYRWIYTRGVKHCDSSGRPVRMLGCHIDVTERKQAEETLRHIVHSVTSTTGQEYFGNLVNYLCDSCEVDYAMVTEIQWDSPNHARTIAVSHCGVLQENFRYELAGTPCGKLWDQKKFSGRGLGMSTVLGIVRGHRGSIHVSSALNVGSTLRILLPVSTTVEHQQERASSAANWQGKGTVLVADDEASVRNSLLILLKTLGYKALAATNGKQAIDMFIEQQDAIDLVLLDLTMPTMDGAQACLELHRLRSDVKVILMSGYNVEFSHEQLVNCGADAFLQKPFRIENLKQLLQQHCRG